MAIDLTVDITQALKKLDVARDQVPFAVALGLTRTAQDAKADLQAAMRAAFKQPTRYTLNSITIQKATKSETRASVLVKGKAVSWLGPEIFGGQRDRAIEKLLDTVGLPPNGLFAVPGPEAKFSGNGKVSIAWLRQVLAGLGYTGRLAGRYARARRGNAASPYFVLSERTGRLAPGIYQRRGSSSVALLIAFVGRPTYRARFDFFGVAEASVKRNWERELRRAVAEALATAR